jgi:hypothetical protein
MTNYTTTVQTGTSRQIPIACVDDLELKVVDEQGAPAKGWYFSLLDGDGTEHKGQLDGGGTTKVEAIRKGACRLRVSPAPLDAKSSSSPAPAPPPCPDAKGSAGDGPTARRRRGDGASS